MRQQELKLYGVTADAENNQFQRLAVDSQPFFKPVTAQPVEFKWVAIKRLLQQLRYAQCRYALRWNAQRRNALRWDAQWRDAKRWNAQWR